MTVRDGGTAARLLRSSRAAGTDSDNVTDLSPLRALTGLQGLNCNAKNGGKLADLSPLRGLSLTGLTFGSTQVRDLTPLKGMPL